MNTRRLVLSFLLTLGVGAPLALTAEGADDPEIEVAPRFVETAAVASVDLRATVIRSTSRLVEIRVTGKNTGDEPVDTKVEVVARRSGAGSEMARMAPRPEIVARRSVTIHAAPGQEIDQVVTFDKLKLGSAKGLKKRPVYATVFASSETASRSLAMAFDDVLE